MDASVLVLALACRSDLDIESRRSDLGSSLTQLAAVEVILAMERRAEMVVQWERTERNVVWGIEIWPSEDGCPSSSCSSCRIPPERQGPVVPRRLAEP